MSQPYINWSLHDERVEAVAIATGRVQLELKTRMGGGLYLAMDPAKAREIIAALSRLVEPRVDPKMIVVLHEMARP